MITKKDYDKLYELTKARVYYCKSRKCWCALWIDGGYEHKVWYNPQSIDIDTLIVRIIDLQIKEGV